MLNTRSPGRRRDSQEFAVEVECPTCMATHSVFAPECPDPQQNDRPTIPYTVEPDQRITLPAPPMTE